MNKKILPLLSLLMMLALAFTPFAPAHAAGPAAPHAAYTVPVNLNFSYNAATRELVLSTSFENKSLLIGYGQVTIRNMTPEFSWVRTSVQYDKERIVVRYAAPSGAGYYCANVQLYGFIPTPSTSVSDSPTGSSFKDYPYQGSAASCVYVPG